MNRAFTGGSDRLFRDQDLGDYRPGPYRDSFELGEQRARQARAEARAAEDRAIRSLVAGSLDLRHVAEEAIKDGCNLEQARARVLAARKGRAS